MGRTLLSAKEIGNVQRHEFDITTSGEAVIRKVIAGTGVTISSTGIDAGTGDVTINSSLSLAAIGGTPNANGATLSAGVLTLQPADGTNGGLLSNTIQSIPGIKTFSAGVQPNGTIIFKILGAISGGAGNTFESESTGIFRFKDVLGNPIFSSDGNNSITASVSLSSPNINATSSLRAASLKGIAFPNHEINMDATGGAGTGYLTYKASGDSGVSAVISHYFNTLAASTVIGSKLASFANNGVTKAYIDKDGSGIFLKDLKAGSGGEFSYIDANKNLTIVNNIGLTNLSLTKNNTGISDFLGMSDITTSGYINFGSGGTNFIPTIKLSPGSSLNQYSYILTYVNDNVSNPAAIQFDSRTTSGPLVNQDIASFSSYGNQKVVFKANGSINFLGALMPNNLAGTTGQILQSNGAGVAPTWITSSAGGSVGITRSVNNISASTTALAVTNTDYVYFCTNSITLTLPTAVGNTNIYTIKNIGSGVLTITTTSSQNIEGTLTITLNSGTSVDTISDNTNWWII